jgi:predicted alpha/beta hydrolase family esterase
MGRNALLVPGKPSEQRFKSAKELDPSDSNWIPWVKRRLTLRNIFAVAVDVPRPHKPDYEAWRKEFERHEVGVTTTLIGHSAGAGFLLRWLSENPDVNVYKTALVAPWTDPNRKYRDFGDFEIDSNITERCIGGVAVLYDPQDDPQTLASLKTVREKLPEADVYAMAGFGHFMIGNNMKGPEFPELVELVL